VLRNIKLCPKLIILVVLVVALFTPIVASLLSDSVTLRSSGQILLPDLTAASGSASDIQEAVDLVAANFGVGNVHIPEGTWNFVEVGESWKTVTIPAGINVFGAPTQRDANGQVVTWRTVLVMPYDVPGSDSTGMPNWFVISGNSNPNRPSRFSDIKLQGYREINPSSTTMHVALVVSNVIDYRVDHCSFKYTCGGVRLTGHDCCGVFDHNRLVNGIGIHAPYDQITIGYGILMTRATGESEWDTDLSNILGKYNSYTHFIEDCYFSDWRHCTVTNWASHCVFRHNTIQYDNGYGSIDAHMQYSAPYYGGRAYEVYGNSIIEQTESGWNTAANIRSGGGVFFNNTVDATHDAFVNAESDANEIYVWGNNFYGSRLVMGSLEEGVGYFLYQPSWYTPYQYPHPLTLE
jgi:hypothetical protein